MLCKGLKVQDLKNNIYTVTIYIILNLQKKEKKVMGFGV